VSLILRFLRLLNSQHFNFSCAKPCRALLPFAKYFRKVKVWADSTIENISADISDRSRFADATIRGKALNKLLMLTSIFQGYIHVMMFVLHSKYRGKSIAYTDMETFLAPLSVPFKVMPLIEAALPTEKEMLDRKSGKISKYNGMLPLTDLNSTPDICAEDMLWTYILYDLIATVHDTSLIQCSPCVFEHHKKLVKIPNAGYTEHKNIFKGLTIVAKGLSLSEPGGAFEIYNFAGSSWGASSPWYNFARAVNVLFDSYSVFNMDMNGDYRVKLFTSKEVMIAFSKVVKVISIDASTSSIITNPDRFAELTRSVGFFNTGISKIFIDVMGGKHGLLLKSDAKATFKYLSEEKIQKDVAASCAALYTKAITTKLPTVFRIQLCWSVLNVLSMFGTTFILHHKKESYMSNTVLRAAKHVAKSWTAIIHYYTTLSDEEKNRTLVSDWKLVDLMHMSTWPAIFISAIFVQNRKDEDTDTDRGARNYGLEPTNLTVFAKQMDVTRVLDTVENLCEMGATLKWLVTEVDDLGLGTQLIRVSNVASLLLHQMTHSVADASDATTMMQLSASLPQAIKMSIAAMKMTRASLSMSTSALARILEKASIGEREIDSAETLKIKIAFSGFKAINVLELITTASRGYFLCPPNCEKDYTALSLIVIHTVQKIPEGVILNQHFLPALSAAVGVLRVSKTLPFVVLPSDVSAGIERIFAMTENDYQRASARVRTMPGHGPQHEFAMKAFLKDKQDHRDSYHKLRQEAKKASETDSTRAMKRSQVLAVLPCSYVGCNAFAIPGKDMLDSKKCSGCVIVRYCSATCQKKDWKVHKVACKAVATASGK
jgi:MYND finger